MIETESNIIIADIFISYIVSHLNALANDHWLQHKDRKNFIFTVQRPRLRNKTETISPTCEMVTALEIKVCQMLPMPLNISEFDFTDSDNAIDVIPMKYCFGRNILNFRPILYAYDT